MPNSNQIHQNGIDLIPFVEFNGFFLIKTAAILNKKVTIKQNKIKY